MARWVKSYQNMRIYKQSSTPSSATDDLQVGDIWIDTTSGAVVKVCTAVDADTFDVLSDTVSPSFTTPVLGAATATSLDFTSTAELIGTTTNDDANAGSVGELITARRDDSAAISLTSAAASNITSITLTAGDWDVFGVVGLIPGASTSITLAGGWTSSTSATLPENELYTRPIANSFGEVPGFVFKPFPIPTIRYSVAGSTTVYLSALATFTVSTLKAYGALYARRRR